jgi:hypothetical protein
MTNLYFFKIFFKPYLEQLLSSECHIFLTVVLKFRAGIESIFGYIWVLKTVNIIRYLKYAFDVAIDVC